MSPEPNRLRSALVTGAAGNIGRAISSRLAQDGYAVILSDTREDDLDALQRSLARAGHVVAAACGDISAIGGRQTCVQAVNALERPLGVLVNNAAVFPDLPWDAMTDELWMQSLAVNLVAPASLTQALVPLMSHEGDGAIVNISSVRALASVGMGAAYEAAKAGLIALTRCHAVELAPFGIRVNAISPGSVAVGGLAGWPGITAEQRTAFVASQPGGEIGFTEQIAGVVSFLASVDSAFVNGENIVADGGAIGIYGYTAAHRAASSAVVA